MEEFSLNLSEMGHPEWKCSASETLIAVGMSGGVDSSLCAVALKKAGFQVIGLFMKNWEESDENGICQSSKEFQDVQKVCEKFDIPYYSVEFVKEYKESVFSHFLEAYKRGWTPNPDILCNREIKFKVFFEHAMKLGANFLATGHYARNIFKDGKHFLSKGHDQSKDQTYFLYTLKEKILEKVIFPLGHLTKAQVRDYARDWEIPTAEKKDSTGICFIGERNFRPFLSQYIAPKRGVFMTLEGEVVGEHNGACYYTIGQRKGLGLGGPGSPWFVAKKDVKENIVYVIRGEEHPALYVDEIYLTDVSWINDSLSHEIFCDKKISAKIRYRQKDQDCLLSRAQESAKLKVQFQIPQRAAAVGQSVVFYHKDLCLGGGVIDEIGPTYHEQERSLLRPIDI